MTHQWTGNEHSLKARCGRIVRENQLTKAISEVQCKQCRLAFARILAKLPNTNDSTKRQEINQ